MSRFDLVYDIKRALERVVDLDDLLAALFADYPDIEDLDFEVTNEYDDNNYSDYTRLQRVNGWQVDYDGNIEDEDEEHDLPKPSQESIHAAMNLSDFVMQKYGHGEHSFSKGDYDWEGSNKKMKSSPELECAMAALKGERVPVETIMAANGTWWFRHAELHGRYSPEDEFKFFAREGWMGAALNYAQHFGPISDKTLNFFVLVCNSEHEDYENLQKYLDWLREKAA